MLARRPVGFGAPERRDARRRFLKIRAALPPALRLLDALLPPGCAVCGIAVGPEPPICPLCAGRVHAVPPPVCARCGLTRVIQDAGPESCPDCQSWHPGLRARAASLHRGVSADLVRGLKYRGWTALAGYMGRLMVPPARALAGRHRPLLVPVPLARSRRRERGFNQAELLAASMSTRLGWPVRPLLWRHEGGESLVRLGRRDRRTAVSGRFEVAPGAAEKAEDALPTLLVDDVVTTGATAAACFEAMAAAGLTCLGVVSFGRTDPLGDGR